MNGNDRKRPLSVAPPPPQPVAQLSVTAYADRAPHVQCSGDLATAVRLLAVALEMVSRDIQKAQEAGKPPAEDRKREFLGPREP